MDRRRSDGGVEECKGYSPPNDHTTSASSTPLSLDSWDLNAGTRSTETESFRSARVARRRATYAERTERQRLRDAHERRMAGGASPAAGDSTSNWKTRLRSDVQYVVECARTWCSEHRFVFGGPMPCQILVRRLADLIHSCTTRGGKRPLAIDVLVGGVDDRAGPTLHRVQATGAFQRYKAFAAGGGGEAAGARLAADRWATEGTVEEATLDGSEGSPVAAGGDAAREGCAVISEDVHVGGGQSSSQEGNREVSGGEGRASDSNKEATGSSDKCHEATAATRGPAQAMTTKQWSSPGSRRQWRSTEAGQWEGELRTLLPEHREALKRAFLSMCDPAGDRESGETSMPCPGAAAREDQKPEPVDNTYGGLRASELSAVVYGRHASSTGCGFGWSEGTDGEGRHRFEGFECSRADLEAILIELDDEQQRDARSKKQKGFVN